jgi:pectin methylesterase-like acyl-CoA thioesterase
MFRLLFPLLPSILLLSCLLPNAGSLCEYANAFQSSDAKVLNGNTGKTYLTIQGAINAPEMVNGNEIFVASGTYYESITVNKSVSIVGEDRSSTIIDGNGAIKVIYVTADNVEIRNFTVQNGTFGLWLDGRARKSETHG